MMRRMDFRCDVHGVFEAVEALTAPVSERWPCPTCGRSCVKVYLKAPMIGKIDNGTFVTDFPGPIGPDGKPSRITMTRDEVERRLDYRAPEPFSDAHLERTRDQRADALDRLIAAQDAGALPKRPEPTQQQREVIEKALKSAS
jgi:hypothetical protein